MDGRRSTQLMHDTKGFIRISIERSVKQQINFAFISFIDPSPVWRQEFAVAPDQNWARSTWRDRNYDGNNFPVTAS